MGLFAVSAIAFAALASAIPHGSHHHHSHKHIARSGDAVAHVENLAPIAGRSTSKDGSCGSWSGMTCADGFCCGANGWCGNSTDHCGAGCQADFGQCGSSSAPIAAAGYDTPSDSDSSPASESTASSSGGVQVSPNGLCGTQHGYTCQGSNFGDSCSEWGYCGSNSSYTGDGCQSDYGSCGGSVGVASQEPSSEAGSSTAAAVPTKAYSQPPTYGQPSSEAAPSTTLISKAQPTSTQAEPSAPAPTTTSSEEAPPAYSGPPAYSAPPSSAETTSEAPAPTPYTSAESTSSEAAPTSYGSAPSAAASGGPYIRTFKGDGSSSSGWPSQNEWLSIDDMWSINKKILKEGCDYFEVPNDTDDEISALQSAVSEVASSSGVDERFVLAIMLQESNGCVRAPTTTYSHSNPGLFQSHEGSGSCNNGNGVQTPCPKSELKQMVKDGVEGTASGDGLKQLLGKCSSSGAQSFYEAARMYNSGSVDPSGNLGLGVATHCYSSDIANRLIGWSEAGSTCDSTTVGQ